jgi:hypothetical protein
MNGWGLSAHPSNLGSSWTTNSHIRIWSGGTSLQIAILTAAIMTGIEIFQLTQIPLHFRSSGYVILKAISDLL